MACCVQVQVQRSELQERHLRGHGRRRDGDAGPGHRAELPCAADAPREHHHRLDAAGKFKGFEDMAAQLRREQAQEHAAARLRYLQAAAARKNPSNNSGALRRPPRTHARVSASSRRRRATPAGGVAAHQRSEGGSAGGDAAPGARRWNLPRRVLARARSAAAFSQARLASALAARSCAPCRRARAPMMSSRRPLRGCCVAMAAVAL